MRKYQLTLQKMLYNITCWVFYFSHPISDQGEEDVPERTSQIPYNISPLVFPIEEVEGSTIEGIIIETLCHDIVVMLDSKFMTLV